MFEKDNYCFGCLYWRPMGCGCTDCFKSSSFIPPEKRTPAFPVTIIFTTKSRHLMKPSDVQSKTE
jgi:hypothetical protein